MSSEDPIRQVPDELFRKASAKPERSIPDALFGPPPAPPAVEPEAAESGTDEGEAPAEPEGSAPASSVDPPPPERVADVASSAAPSAGDETVSGASAEGVAESAAASVLVAGSSASPEPLSAAVGSAATTDAGASGASADSDATTAESATVDPASAGESVVAAADAVASAEVAATARPVLLVIADSLSYFGPKGGLPADHPRIWPNLVGAELDWDVEVVGRIGWTCRDAYWALIGDPRVWAAVPRAGAVVFAVGGMDSLPSPLPTALRELIRYVRPPALRRRVRATYTWLQPKLSKLGRPVALPPKVSVDYLEQSREALAHLRPDLPFVAVLPSVHNCDAYGRVHAGREPAVKALRAWSARTSVPLVDLGEAVRDNIFSGDANPDGIHWGWAGHTAVANAMVKTLQEVR
nr:diglucosylglycerate octanoyltransferase [Nocardia sp. CS682]